MAINLELPPKMQAVIDKAHQAGAEMMRPIARKYDLKEHAYPVELDTLASLFSGAAESNALGLAGAEAFRGSESKEENRNGANMAAVLQTLEACWGDAAMMLSIPYQGLGNAAISGVATDEQLSRLGRVWAAMAITEPGFGSDSAAVSTTAKLDGDEYVINGEKIFVTAGSRATHIVVWATLDKSQGRSAIKSFIVPREHPGVTVERLENKLGIKGSDTAVIRFDRCPDTERQPAGQPRNRVRPRVFRRDGDLRQHPAGGGGHGHRYCPGRVGGAAQDLDRGRGGDLLRPAVARAECGRGRISAHGGRLGVQLPADLARGVAGRQQDPQLQGSVDGQGQGRTRGHRRHPESCRISWHCRLFRAVSAEKWARDSKIMDIFEGTQQIQQLVVARRLLGLSSSELK